MCQNDSQNVSENAEHPYLTMPNCKEDQDSQTPTSPRCCRLHSFMQGANFASSAQPGTSPPALLPMNPAVTRI